MLDQCALERGLQMLSCDVTGRFIFCNSNFVSGSLDVEKSKLRALEFSHLDLQGTGLRLDSSVIADYIRFSIISSSGGYSFINSKFAKDIYIVGGEVASIICNGSEFKEAVRLQAIKNNGSFTSSSDVFEKAVQIDFDDSSSGIFGYQKSIYFQESKFSAGLLVNGSEFIIESLTIVCSQELQGTIHFNDCRVLVTEIKNYSHGVNIIFSYVRFGKLNFDNYTNDGNLTLSSCSSLDIEDSYVAIQHSNLGKAQFMNFSLESFKRVRIFDSILSSIEFSGISWFTDTALDVGAKATSDQKRREVYRQLKQASEKQNDRIQALRFQAIELAAFGNMVRKEEGFLGNDRLILWLSLTNDFGLNWRKPFAYLITITTLLYFPLVFSVSDRLTWRPACNSKDVINTLEEFWSYSYVWPQLFNPARPIKQIFNTGKDLAFGAYFWDGVQRIVLAFFIVQIVSAFRKFVKS